MTNVEYTDARDALIPIAEKYTNDTVGPIRGPAEDRADWAANWSMAFLKKMDELAREQGLIQ